MEFNQDNRSFCTTVAVLDTVAEQLADVDLTLPDYCPDIEKILKEPSYKIAWKFNDLL